MSEGESQDVVDRLNAALKTDARGSLQQIQHAGGCELHVMLDQVFGDPDRELRTVTERGGRLVKFEWVPRAGSEPAPTDKEPEKVTRPKAGKKG